MAELAIVFSDLHVHNYKSYNENDRRLNNGIDFINYAFKLADKNNIKYLFMPGDLYNLMQVISTVVVNAIVSCLSENFKKYPEINLIAVSGNHEMATKSLIDSRGKSALEHLAIIFPENFYLLDGTELDDFNTVYVTDAGHVIRGICYFEHAEHFRATLLERAQEVTPGTGYNTFLLMHQTVASGLPIEDDIEAIDPLFDKFTMIFNGHIHDNQQITDKFINVGSPLHRDAGDIGKRKGFWIVDLDDPVNTISFKDITDRYPQFIQKTVGEELTEWEQNQYVMWVPAELPEETSDKSRSEKFQTKLSPQALLENYCKEVLPEKDLKAKLEYGLKLL